MGGEGNGQLGREIRIVYWQVTAHITHVGTFVSGHFLYVHIFTLEDSFSTTKIANILMLIFE